jgi:hypothetical protein
MFVYLKTRLLLCWQVNSCKQKRIEQVQLSRSKCEVGNAVSFLKGVLAEQKKLHDEGQSKEYWGVGRPYLIVRTKWFDDHLLEGVKESKARQVC